MADLDGFEVGEDFRFHGRTFEEYRRMFGLSPDDLAGRRLLDCGGASSSFSAVAAWLAEGTTAVDPMYDRPLADLEVICEEAIAHSVDQLREKRDAFVWDYYGDVDTRERYLRAAAERFLADFAHDPGRYVPAALPDLPFESRAFDLALSGNLCFLYDDRLDLNFHVAAILELVRVAEEVRVFPLVSLDVTRSAYVDPVVESLRDAGHAVSTRDVDYEFQPGATAMLVVESGPEPA